MFGMFKSDPLKKLNQSYLDLLEKAQQAQRNGDIEGYSRISAEAEKILQKIEAHADK
jgi:hypothetical protein